MAGRDDVTPTRDGTDAGRAPTRPHPEPQPEPHPGPPPQRSPEGDDAGRRAQASTPTPHASDEPGSVDGRSLGQLVASASRDVSALVRGEIALAKAELKESATAAGKGVAMAGAAGFLAAVAFLMLSVAAAYGLTAAGLHPAVSFVVVGAAYLLVAGLLGLVGLRSLRHARPPARTMQSIGQAKEIVGRGSES